MEKSTIQRIERVLMNCTINNLLRLANALGVSIGSLFDFNDPTDEVLNRIRILLGIFIIQFSRTP